MSDIVRAQCRRRCWAESTSPTCAKRAAGGDGASSPDAVARWLWNKIGKR